MPEFSEADVQDWESRAARVWTAYVAGERNADVLGCLLEQDGQIREHLIEEMVLAAASGDAEAMWVLGRVAIAGCGAMVDSDEGWFLIEYAADDGWAPARELLERRKGSTEPSAG